MKGKLVRGIGLFFASGMILLQIGCTQQNVEEEREMIEEDNKTVIVESDEKYLSVTDEKAYRELAWDYTVESDIPFGQAEGINGTEELKLDLYMTEKEGENPAVLLLHGGALISGDKANEGMIKNLAIDYAKMGYVAVVPNYRLGTSASEEALNHAMEDTKAAYEWVLENGKDYGIDTEYIVLGGYSAGADIALNTYYSNFFQEMERENIKCILDISGGYVYYGIARGALAGCVIVHGTADTTVNFEKSETTAGNLESNAIDVLFYPLEGINHDVLIKYDEVRNVMAEYMYKSITGTETEIEIQSDVSKEYQKTLNRKQNGMAYQVKQIDVVADGNLDEWSGVEKIKLNQIKDAGGEIPQEKDYSGEAMIGWNEENPTTLYIAAKIKDDVIKNSVSESGEWYLDDCLEIAFDFTSEQAEQQVLKWVIGIEGDDLSVYATAENTTVVTNKVDDTYICEIGIDVGKLPEGAYQGDINPTFSTENSIGFSICYNDCENNTREHQLGWTSGKAGDKSSFGTLYFQK